MIGLEAHLSVRAPTKLFCSCSSGICEICTAQPGAKPMAMSTPALLAALKLAQATRCKLAPALRVLRKHYFYPDLPAGYQRTTTPIGRAGTLAGISLWELHVEEDPGSYDPKKATVDYRRAGLPLIELVTAPELQSPADVKCFLTALLDLVRFLGICEPAATIKCDVNVSTTGERVEVKNVLGIERAVAAAAAELERQDRLLAEGHEIRRETRWFDELMVETIASREKEQSADYRFIEDPDCPPIAITPALIAAATPEADVFTVRAALAASGIPADRARLVTHDRESYQWFQQLSATLPARFVAEWLGRDLQGELDYRGIALAQAKLQVKDVQELLGALHSGTLTPHAARARLRQLLDRRPAPEQQPLDTDAALRAVLAQHADVVARLKTKPQALAFLLGEANKALGFRVHPKELRERLKRLLR